MRPDPTHAQCAAVATARAELDAAMVGTPSRHPSGFIAALHAVYAASLAAAGLPAPCPLADWPRTTPHTPANTGGPPRGHTAHG